MEAIKYLKQADFPYLNDFLKKFRIDNQTVFAYDNTIFANHNLPPDILEHELVHIKRMADNPDKWIRQYLKSKQFRLAEEIIAFRFQINSIKNREARNHCRQECANNLSDVLYDNLVSYAEAMKLLS